MEYAPPRLVLDHHVGPGGNTGSFYGACWSPDGSRIAGGGDDGTVRVWATDGREVLVIPAHVARVWSVAWAPDGSRLASGSADGAVRVWDGSTGAERARLDGHAAAVWSVTWSPDGSRVASGGEDATIRVWDPATGAERARLDGHGSKVRCIAWSPDGSLLASASEDNTVRLWDTATGVERARFDKLSEAIWYCDLAWSPDGSLIAAVDGIHVRVWDVATVVEVRRTIPHGVTTHAVAWSPDGTWLATVAADRTVRVSATTNGWTVARVTAGETSHRNVRWSPTAPQIATTTHDGRLLIWAVAERMRVGLESAAGPSVSGTWRRAPSSTASSASRLRASRGLRTARSWSRPTLATSCASGTHADRLRSLPWSPSRTLFSAMAPRSTRARRRSRSAARPSPWRCAPGTATASRYRPRRRRRCVSRPTTRACSPCGSGSRPTTSCPWSFHRAWTRGWITLDPGLPIVDGRVEVRDARGEPIEVSTESGDWQPLRVAVPAARSVVPSPHRPIEPWDPTWGNSPILMLDQSQRLGEPRRTDARAERDTWVEEGSCAQIGWAAIRPEVSSTGLNSDMMTGIGGLIGSRGSQSAMRIARKGAALTWEDGSPAGELRAELIVDPGEGRWCTRFGPYNGQLTVCIAGEDLEPYTTGLHRAQGPWGGRSPDFPQRTNP